MKTFAIGDVHGCFDTLNLLLEKLPVQRRLIFIGDIINRGPKPLETIRAVMRMKNAECLLGNHELHFLAVCAGQRKLSPSDTLDPILQAPDLDEIIDWLRHRPMALYDKGFLCVHAAVHHSWSVKDCLKQASRVEEFLRSDKWEAEIGQIFGKQQWEKGLKGLDRLRAIVNVLTRTRYLNEDGTMDFSQKLSPGDTPAQFIPWFNYPGRKTEKDPIVFGHWSTLGETDCPNIYPLDTGCLWGGSLSAMKLSKHPIYIREKAPLYRSPKSEV